MSAFNDEIGARETIARVVRGALSWRDLGSVGVGVIVTDDCVEQLCGLSGPVLATAKDIRGAGCEAAHMVSHGFANGPGLVHGAVGLVEFDLDEHAQGEAVPEALCQAVFREPLTAEMTATMKRVLAS